VLTKRLSGTDGVVRELHGVRVEWTQGERGWKMTEIRGSDFSMRADLVLIAMGFTHAVHEGLVKESRLALDARGNIMADEECQTSRPKVFTAGDASRGASLVAHALASGRQAARAIDRKLR
jgi:glutamate synthase (NADPH/NADH) small chain